VINWWDSFKKGLKWSLPVMLGYIPIGGAYGLLAQQTGLSIGVTAGMSVFVFAGASQFMAVSMFMNDSSPAVLIGTTFAVNFRHALMSASLSPYLSGWRKSLRAAFGWMLTDESFALHSVHFANGDSDRAAAITLNAAAYLAWAVSSVAGYKLGALIQRPEAWGVDFALPAMFIGLLMPTCRSRRTIAAALTGGGVSVALCLAGVGGWAAFIGAVAGATAGVCMPEGGRDGR
jgi:4-azaleucine resistance transporter AzlC